MLKQRTQMGLMIGLVLSLLFIAGRESHAADKRWQFAGFTKDRDAVFLDSSRIETRKDGIYDVVVRVTPREKGRFRKELLRYLESTGRPPTVQYLEMHLMISCSRHEVRHYRTSYYTRADAELFSVTSDNAPWRPVGVASTWQGTQKRLCPAGR